MQNAATCHQAAAFFYFKLTILTTDNYAAKATNTLKPDISNTQNHCASKAGLIFGYSRV